MLDTEKRREESHTPENVTPEKGDFVLPSRPVLIFDGVCTLCNNSVDFMISRPASGALLFTSNQSETGQEILAYFDKRKDDVDTVYLLADGKLHDRTSATLRASRYLSFPWKLGFAALIIPKPIRDFFYKIIARNRYRWFGKRDSCRLPSLEERARFLD